MRYLLYLGLGVVACALSVFRLAAEDLPTPTVTVAALDADHKELAAVLALCVKSNGVDYATLRRERTALERYRAQLATATMPSDKAGKLALIINAYNACTLHLVVLKLPADETTWPTWSIKMAGGTVNSVWESYTFVVAGQRYTLDQLEHQLLRPLGDPRVHFAVNCASRSCPPLLAKPFLAHTVDVQLNTVATTFATDAYHVRLANGTLQVNPILDWFAEDFSVVGGVAAFLAPRATPPVRQYLEAGKKIRFFEYDWSLNLAAAH
jgi:Protein of unknown function, DUF547